MLFPCEAFAGQNYWNVNSPADDVLTICEVSKEMIILFSLAGHSREFVTLVPPGDTRKQHLMTAG